ncbi:ABC transporter permease [Sulfolobales archaeon HS-7]|nr:ABC transporter permease [Sulfolobales archaeon HS-7]
MLEKIISYEIKRSIARKKVLVIIAITVIFEVGTYVALSQVKSQALLSIIQPLKSVLWIAGALLPQSLLLHFIAISIASGSLSEEYEQGTVDFFLTKPLSRLSFATGKFLGGYILFIAVYGLMLTISLVMSFLLFGDQTGLNYIPALFFLVIFSSLTFYSIAYMLGEIIRRSNLAFLAASSILIGSLLIEAVLIFVSRLTDDLLFQQIAIVLPSWGATELPFLLASHIPNASLIVEAVEVFPIIAGTQLEAYLYTISYSVSAVFVAFFSFLKRDIPKKIS